MNGVAGLNTRTLGVSRDMIMSAALALGGKYLLCQDDPDLAALAASAGLKVIYRQSQDETLSLDPAAFVAERAKNAPAAAYLHLTNELDPTPDQLAWTLEAMSYANSIKRKVVANNYSTHRSAKQWEDARPTIAYAVQHGHAIGVHVYSRHLSEPDALVFLPLKQRYNGVWIVTEFGYALDAHHGWRGTLSQQQYADFCAAWLPTFARENMPVLLFSYDHWTANEEGKAHGFGVNDAPEFLSALAVLNAKYPLQETVPVPPTPYPPGALPAAVLVNQTAGLKLRPNPTVTQKELRIMAYREQVTRYAQPMVVADGYAWYRVLDGMGNAGWCADPIQGVPSFIDAAPVPPTLRLKNPVGCAHIITSKFGVARDYDGDGIFDDIHEGLDITHKHSDCMPLILNGAAGVVMDVSSAGDYGNHVIVSTVIGSQEFRAWYCHMAQMFVSRGQVVKAGDLLGVMGRTGNSTGVHLHLNVQKIGAPTPAGSPVPMVIDPEPLIQW